MGWPLSLTTKRTIKVNQLKCECGWRSACRSLPGLFERLHAESIQYTGWVLIQIESITSQVWTSDTWGQRWDRTAARTLPNSWLWSGSPAWDIATFWMWTTRICAWKRRSHEWWLLWTIWPGSVGWRWLCKSKQRVHRKWTRDCALSTTKCPARTKGQRTAWKSTKCWMRTATRWTWIFRKGSCWSNRTAPTNCRTWLSSFSF